MAIYEITPPANRQELDAGRVQDFLRAQGITVEWVAVRTREDGSIYYAVEAATDPAPAIANYVRPVNDADRAKDRLRDTFPKLIDGTATARETQLALAALIVVFRESFST